MTNILKRALSATAVGAIALAAPVAAQTAKVATVNSLDAMFNIQALPTALDGIDKKYATQLKQAGDRQAKLQADVKPFYDALDLNKDGRLDQTEQQAAVQAQKPQVKQIRDAEAAAQAQVGPLVEPVNIARIYVFDQLLKRYNTSLDGLVRTRQIGLVLPNTGVVRQGPGTDLTATIRTEIDKPLLIDTPAGWRPTAEGASLLDAYLRVLAEAEQRQAQQAAAQQQGARPAAVPATTTPAPAGARPARDRNGDPIKQ